MAAKARDGERPLVLVTGATGLIGSRIGADLAADHHVVGLDLRGPPDDAPGDWIECDLTEDGSVERALSRLGEEHGCEIASAIHLAAYYDFSGEPSPLYDELTVEGTRRLLRALRRFDVGQFVFSSSLLVQRAAEPGEVLTEGSPLEAEWEYPRSKLDAERVIREERGAIPTVVLRIAGVYDEDGHSVPIAQQMRRIYERKLESFFFPGDPDRGQSFVHLDDVVRCFRRVVERREELGDQELFLVGEPDVVGYAELQDLLGKAVHRTDWLTIRVPAPLAKVGAWIRERVPGEDPFIKSWMIDLADAHLPVSIDRARQKLGWEPQRSLRATLAEMARRLVENPEAWYERNGIDPPEDLPELRHRVQEVARERGESRS